MLAFFSWWYGAGWAQVAHSFQGRLTAVLETFSVRQLLHTLFAPWKRIISYPGASLGDKFRAWSDNLFSRVVGFIVRLLFLLAAGVSIFLVATLTALELLAWPLLPAAVPGLIVIGLVL